MVRYLTREHVQNFSLQARVIPIPSPFEEPPEFSVFQAASDLSNALGREHTDLGCLVMLLVAGEDPELTVPSTNLTWTVERLRS